MAFKNRLITLVIYLALTVELSAQVPSPKLPDFHFFRMDKTLFTPGNLPKGQPLFFFFFDTDCDHCQHAMTNLAKNYRDYQSVAIYLITLSDKDRISAFMSKYGPGLATKKNVTLLQDVNNNFITQFKPRRYPAMFLYSVTHELLDYEDNEESMFRFSNQLKKFKK